MKHLMIVILVALGCLPLGCTAFSTKAKMEQYGQTMDSYETAMRTSDFNAVCQVVDPSVISRQKCLERFGDIKIVDYKMTDMRVSEDQMNIDQEIEVGYYFLNHYLLKNTRYRQTWHYQKDRESWLLQSPPPFFK